MRPTRQGPLGWTLLLGAFVDLATGEERRPKDSPRGEYSAVFANDGRRVAFHSEAGSESQSEVMNLDGSGPPPRDSGE